MTPNEIEKTRRAAERREARARRAAKNARKREQRAAGARNRGPGAVEEPNRGL